MKYFSKDLSLEDGKSLYKRLLMENHPDHGGSNEACSEVIKEFQSFCKFKVQEAFNKSKNTFDHDANVFADILNKVMDFNCRIEIIGYWIYAFDSYEVKDQLRELGFFFSSTHKAWIYNGGTKKRRATGFTLAQTKGKYGYKVIREKKEAVKIS